MRRANVPYTLWKRMRGTEGRWIRIGEHSMVLDSARRHYQTRLIANAMGLLDVGWEYRLRPIPSRDQGKVR